jgi:hypothetical protein
MPDETLRLAVLIDADNASATVIGDILSEVAAIGTASVKRIYGDFTSPNLSSWRAVLAEHAIQPVQQFRNTVGKNASDSALIIDSMDLLHTRALGGFCLVSSDSDFTRLATRIREDGVPVYGFGEQKTPKAFIQACDRFFYTEIFRTKGIAPATVKAAAQASPLRDVPGDEALKAALDQAIDAATRVETGRANLAAVGDQLHKLLPDFDPRNYGFKQLSDLLRQLPGLNLKYEQRSGAPPIVYLERK